MDKKKRIKLAKDMAEAILEETIDFFEEQTSEIAEIIITQYEGKLNGVVKDRRSQINPEEFQDEFMNRLYNFEYISNIDSNGFDFNIPDIDNFDFSEDLEGLKVILEGMIGRYYEVKGEDYRKATGKNPLNKVSFGNNLPIRKRVYLISIRDPELKNIEDVFGDDYLVEYAFSNTPPIDIFGEANAYYNENKNRWLEESRRNAIDRFKKKYHKGVM